ncbi:(d)CMP kinase [Massilia sp. Mn16-1_5]|uniref:(d)CMP kinase n=1 Tax=Massilia sp. Mn16-1_5 TaxID=2079199 RepID=UPI00109E3F82|nr:(d)CMP kinase [Massilia sp. Mn16-1_5]THC44955.1 (d)CMP kinase [Massilia sp. Mn16-1_5]
MPNSHIPVITIDGPTASGKGTVAARVADRLGYHLLDSGALYRLTALSAMRAGVALDDEQAVARLAQELPASFSNGDIFLAGEEVGAQIRAEEVGNNASRIAAFPGVRQALYALQLGFRKAPGLVADGRDMGTVIFPNARLKVFLTASVEARAERRYKQLIGKGISANMEGLLADLQARDDRDTHRTVAPLVPAEGAYILDTSDMTVDEAVEQVLHWHTLL